MDKVGHAVSSSGFSGCGHYQTIIARVVSRPTEKLC